MLHAAEVRPRRLNITGGFLYMATDGLTEAHSGGRELGIGGLAWLASRLVNSNSGNNITNSARDKVRAVMALFETGRMTTHDDAALLVLSGLVLPGPGQFGPEQSGTPVLASVGAGAEAAA